MSLDTDLLAAMRTVSAATYRFPAVKPSATTYATYQTAGGRLHGTLNSGLGAQNKIYQIDVWSSEESGAACETLAQQLKDELPDLLKVGEISDNPAPPDETGPIKHRASFDITVWAR